MCLPLKPVLSRDRRGLPNFIDEPSAGLDNSSVELLKNCICKIAKQSIVIIVTHDENLCSICDVLYEL